MGRHEFQIFGPPTSKQLTESNLELYAEDISYRLGKTGRTLADRRNAFTVHEIEGGESFDIGGIHVSTAEVPHTIHSIAYRFDFEGESLLVTGDLTDAETLAELAEDVDFLIIDAGGIVKEGAYRARGRRRPGSGTRAQRERAHLNLDESSALATRGSVRTLVYTHFTPGDVDEEASLDEVRKNYDGNVIFGEDLMVLSNPDDDPRTGSAQPTRSYPIVDTGQKTFFGDDGEIPAPALGDPFYGQDAQYPGTGPSYSENGDGTITDRTTGLMWQQGFEVMSYDEALQYAGTSTLAGHEDWRLPSIKEMYSLIRFDGVDPSGRDMGSVPEGAKPFIDTDFFDFEYGANGTRVIDSQYLTATIYTGRTMRNDRAVFGVNMADGRIKGYPMVDPRSRSGKAFSVKLVRGNPDYGENHFEDNHDGTVSDAATGLMWAKDDSKRAMSWQEALAWVQQKNEKSYLGHSDWRLPDAKELHSILDYSRSPQATNSAAIDPVFSVSTIENETGEADYPFFWSSTTHLNTNGRGSSAVYLCFGEGLGFMRPPGAGEPILMDVHGAGAQRSDPKSGDAADYPWGHGPQGDVVRITNYARLVRSMD
jgi:phosphoribosyl 1,2-cyclic phosphodiesterase